MHWGASRWPAVATDDERAQWLALVVLVSGGDSAALDALRSADVRADLAAAAHATGLYVVAEGTEAVQQLEVLRDAGCARLQGHVVARPGSVEVLRVLAAAGRTR